MTAAANSSLSHTWTVLGSIVSPRTGTIFTKITTEYNHRYVIWHAGNIFMQSGDILRSEKNKLTVNNSQCEIHILNLDKFNPSLWQVMRSISGCPGNAGDLSQECEATIKCTFCQCPYGKVALKKLQ